MALKGMDSIELEENIYPIDAIDQELAGNLTIDKLFDVYRFRGYEDTLSPRL